MSRTQVATKDNTIDIVRQNLLQMLQFRQNMGVTLSIKRAVKIFGHPILLKVVTSIKTNGSEYEKTLVNEAFIDSDNMVINKRVLVGKQKLKIGKQNMGLLIVPVLTKFIGVSGSIAAGTVSPEDDIDLFVVVQDHTMWLYRLIVHFKARFSTHWSGVLRIRRGDDKDKFCLNFIVEERGLPLEKSFFNFHELMFLRPLWNERYYKVLMRKHKWLKAFGWVGSKRLEEEVNMRKQDSSLGCEGKAEKSNFFVHILLRLLNGGAFIIQFSYMPVGRDIHGMKTLLHEMKFHRIAVFKIDPKKNKVG